MVFGPVFSNNGFTANAQQSVPDAPAPQQNIPSAPTPQSPPADDSISGLASQAAHGKAAPDDTQTAAPAQNTPTSAAPADGPAQEDVPSNNYKIVTRVNFVEIPVMGRVNNSLSAITGAFTPIDEAAVYTYADGVTQQTTFTVATGDRLPAILVRSKSKGEDMGTADTSGGPFSQGPTINNKPIDPNLTPQRSTNGFITLPKEVHTLNDAILAAAEGLSTVKKGRRRIIYVISDGKESRSKAKLPPAV